MPDLGEIQDITKEDLNNAEKTALLLAGLQNQKPIPGNLWFQKELFEVAQEVPSLSEYFDFEAHLQGPFSETVNNIVEDLQYMGLVDKDRHGIKLTRRGSELYNEIRDGSNDRYLEILRNKKDKLNDLTKDEVLVYVYYRHPDMTTQSLEKEDIEEKREIIAKRLYDKGKVDLETAATIAGVSKDEFIP